MWGEGRNIFRDPSQKERTSSPHLFPSPSPHSPLVSASFGDHHYALLTQDGAVFTGGTGQYSELGYPSKGQDTPRRVPDLPPCVSVHCGEWQTAALARDGTVWTWGWGGSLFSPNALGHGTKSTCTTPTQVTGLTHIQQLAGGKAHYLAVTAQGGEVWSWGKGEFGRLGLGDSGNQLRPMKVEALTGQVKTVACGSSFNAAVLGKGDLLTWGRNEAGQLGLGVGLTLDTYSMESVPARVDFDNDGLWGEKQEEVLIRDVVCGHRHQVALSQKGDMYLFGMRVWMKPVRIEGDNGALRGRRMVAVGAGKNWSIGVDEEGYAWSWGSGSSGCLGHGDLKAVKEPKRIAGFGPGGQFGRAEKVFSGFMDKVAVLARK